MIYIYTYMSDADGFVCLFVDLFLALAVGRCTYVYINRGCAACFCTGFLVSVTSYQAFLNDGVCVGLSLSLAISLSQYKCI